MPLFGANVTEPRRYRTIIACPIDLTVTPPATVYGGSSPVPGQIQDGEFVFLTAAFGAASLATAGANNANAAKCIGISNSNFPLVYAAGIVASTVIPGDAASQTPLLSLFEDGDHLFNVTAGDVLQPYAPVYLGADGRTFTVAASGAALGYVSPDQRPANLNRPAIAFGTAVSAGQLAYIRFVSPIAK